MNPDEDLIQGVLDGFVPLGNDHATAVATREAVAERVAGKTATRPAVGIGEMLEHIVARLERIEKLLEDR